MRKILLGTTALVTAGLITGAANDASAAEKIKLGLSGYFQQWVVAADQNLKDVNGRHDFDTSPIDEKHNGEVCFIGETKLDNGLTIGVNIQLEAQTSSDQIDESYLYVKSEKLGMVILGDENNAAYLMAVQEPNGGISINHGDFTSQPQAPLVALPQQFDLNDTTIDGTLLRYDDNDSGKITYMTPRFYGIQLGASYIPKFENGGDDNNTISRCPSGAGSVPCNTTVNGNATADRGIINGYAAAANYKEDFNGVGVQASAGLMGGNTPPNQTNGTVRGSGDLFAWSTGLQVNFGGFSVGGSYANANGDKRTNESYDGYGYGLGAAYETGPYTIGINYYRGESEGVSDRINGAKQYMDVYMLSGSYALGPGIRLVGGVFAWDADGENGTATTPPAAGNPTTGNPNQYVQDSNGYGAATA